MGTLISGSLEHLTDQQIMGAMSQRSQLIQQMKGEAAYKNLSPAELEKKADELILQQLMYDSALASVAGAATHSAGTLMAGLNEWQDGQTQPVESFGEDWGNHQSGEQILTVENDLADRSSAKEAKQTKSPSIIETGGRRISNKEESDRRKGKPSLSRISRTTGATAGSNRNILPIKPGAAA